MKTKKIPCCDYMGEMGYCGDVCQCKKCMPPQGVNASEHTPTPWKVSQTGKFVMHSRPGTVLNVCEASESDAAYIVRAVNEYDSDKTKIQKLEHSHEDLVGALLNIKANLSGTDYLQARIADSLRRIDEAIAQVEGK